MMVVRRVIFLGNTLFLEDKIALIIGELLRKELEEKGFDVEITERAGISLLDLIVDVDEVFIVDSVYVTKENLYGEVFELDLESFYGSPLRTPHTLSLRDLVEIAKLNNLKVPEKIIVIGIGIRDLETLSEDLSDFLKARLEYIKGKVLELIKP